MPKPKGILFGVIAMVALAVGWWLGSPLFLDETVDEAFPLTAGAIVPDSMTRDEVERIMSEVADTDRTANEDMPAGEPGPAPIKAGRFRDADRFHRGTGTATIYRLPSGDHVLRLDDFDVTNGPDLRVLLSPHPDPHTREDVNGSNYIELGKLKGNVGSQNYEVPANVDIATQRSVIIYCRPFHVIFSVAPLIDELSGP